MRRMEGSLPGTGTKLEFKSWEWTNQVKMLGKEGLRLWEQLMQTPRQSELLTFSYNRKVWGVWTGGDDSDIGMAGVRWLEESMGAIPTQTHTTTWGYVSVLIRQSIRHDINNSTYLSYPLRNLVWIFFWNYLCSHQFLPEYSQKMRLSWLAGGGGLSECFPPPHTHTHCEPAERLSFSFQVTFALCHIQLSSKWKAHPCGINSAILGDDIMDSRITKRTFGISLGVLAGLLCMAGWAYLSLRGSSYQEDLVLFLTLGG